MTTLLLRTTLRDVLGARRIESVSIGEGPPAWQLGVHISRFGVVVSVI